MNELKKMILAGDLYRTMKDAPRRVEFAVPSVEAGLRKAAEYFRCAVEDVAYDIIENGKEGVFGVGGKPYRVSFSYTPSIQGSLLSARSEEQFILGPLPDARKVIEPKDKDSEATVRVTRNGVMLKVTPKKGKGKAIEDPLVVQQMLLAKEIFQYDVELVNRIVKQAKGQSIKIADWQPNIYNDGRVTLDIAEDEMRVFVNVSAPQKTGREIDEQDIREMLESNSVSYGIDEKAIKEVVERSITGRPFLIATGTPAVNGENARIEYKVDIEKKNVPKAIDENSDVDYKDLSIIENVTVGQVLAQKIEASDGVPGKTVKGRFMEAKKGKDIEFGDILGQNVEMSADKTKVVSKINGQVVNNFNKLSVEPIFTVKGDVGPETGNITFLGNVIVGGNVLDNYKIQAAGNIDIKGSVGKAELDSEGDIMVKLGIQGKGGAKLKAGNDVIVKFLENAHVDVGRDVVVTESIMHSTIDAGRRVILVGRKSVITGGRVRAFEEVNAKVFGSASSAKTVIEVGIAPRIRQRMDDLNAEKEGIEKTIEELGRNVKTLEGLAKAKKLDEEKEKLFTDSKQKYADDQARMIAIAKELEEITAYLMGVQVEARISAAKTVFPGVRVAVKSAYLDVRDTFKAVTFFEEANNIQIEAYKGTPTQVKRAAV
ncbi:MAG: FapA family protein [Spirochaetota bacterium]|mgnify:CR=1 FL=1